LPVSTLFGDIVARVPVPVSCGKNDVPHAGVVRGFVKKQQHLFSAEGRCVWGMDAGIGGVTVEEKG